MYNPHHNSNNLPPVQRSEQPSLLLFNSFSPHGICFALSFSRFISFHFVSFRFVSFLSFRFRFRFRELEQRNIKYQEKEIEINEGLGMSGSWFVCFGSGQAKCVCVCVWWEEGRQQKVEDVISFLSELCACVSCPPLLSLPLISLIHLCHLYVSIALQSQLSFQVSPSVKSSLK
jgi:hypothetical protein